MPLFSAPWLRRRSALAWLALGAVACGGSTSTSTSGGSSTSAHSIAKLSIVSGNGAAFVVGTNVADTLVVSAVDSVGVPVSGGVVGWYANPDCCSSALNVSGIAVMTGVPQNTTCPQNLAAASNNVCSTTDATGTARAAWYFGGSSTGSPPVFAGQTRAGSLQARVQAAGQYVPMDSFTVTAEPGPPASIALSVNGGNPCAKGCTNVCPGTSFQIAVDSVNDQYQNRISGSAAAVTWSSANTGIATVSASGLVTGVANGTVQITATDGSASATETAFVSPAC